MVIFWLVQKEIEVLVFGLEVISLIQIISVTGC